MSSVKIDIVEKNYQDQKTGTSLYALKNFKSIIKSGEFCCIIGPSGCGKTSLLNLISGLDKQFEGDILINGLTPSKAAAPGYMFQSPRLMPWLTVRQNIELVLKEKIKPSNIDSLLKELELSDFGGTYPHGLSGGMSRRVALARAIVNEPKLLLLDEPFLSLDLPVASRLRDLLTEVSSRRLSTVLFVTHDLSEAIYLADRILFISGRPGKVILDYPINLRRPRNQENKNIEYIKLKLRKEYPELLSGEIKR